MRPTLAIAATIAAGLTLAGVTSASAQYYSRDLIASCTQTVGQLKFEGWAADRNREMMMLSCEQNGGIIPGGQDTRPVSLRGANRAPRH